MPGYGNPDREVPEGSRAEAPLEDTTHNAFEVGDCFLVFLDDSEAKVTKSSTRFEKMAEVDALLETVKPNYDSGSYYLTDSGKQALAADMNTIKAQIAELTDKYLRDIEKKPNTDRQYLGQPDMVRTKTGRLITAYPVGHGPIVMQISEDNGETWTEYEHFWPEVDGSKYATIVAMASLIQLKDENGDYIPKWMGGLPYEQLCKL